MKSQNKVQSDFLSLKDVFFDYTSGSVWTKLLGQKIKSHSALRKINLELPLSSHITLFGHEASGKTTFLRMLTGILEPTSGLISLNGTSPKNIKDIAAGYVSPEETEAKETSHQILTAYARTHNIENAASRISEISDILELSTFMHRKSNELSTIQLIRLNIARAALSESPLILLDDVVSHLGATSIKNLLVRLFNGRTVIVGVRFPHQAENLNLPILLLHGGTLTHQGTIDEISRDLSCPRHVDVWIEGLRYDLLRKLRRQSGVAEARLIPSSRFSGQRLRVTLRSARHLPAMYDLVSGASLISVEEVPPSFNDIINRLS